MRIRFMYFTYYTQVPADGKGGIVRDLSEGRRKMENDYVTCIARMGDAG